MRGNGTLFYFALSLLSVRISWRIAAALSLGIVRKYSNTSFSSALKYEISLGDKKDAPAQALMKWNEVAEPVSRLIAQDRYVTQKDILYQF